MDFHFVLRLLIELFGLGCIFAIIFWMCNLVESKVPEPFKQAVGWLKVFIMLLCGVILIYIIADATGIGSAEHISLGH
jgi:hypothetical protein